MTDGSAWLQPLGAEHRETRDLLRARLQLVARAVRCQHAVGSLLETPLATARALEHTIRQPTTIIGCSETTLPPCAKPREWR